MAMSVFSGKEHCDGLAMSAMGTGMSRGDTLQSSPIYFQFEKKFCSNLPSPRCSLIPSYFLR